MFVTQMGGQNAIMAYDRHVPKIDKYTKYAPIVKMIAMQFLVCQVVITLM
jgi:hypothetical protein